MRNSTFAAAAAIAAGLAVATLAANAMPVATSSRLGLAEGAASAPEKTVLVCDPWTCYWRPGDWGPNPYWGWRRHYWWGWHRPSREWHRRWDW
jgi:hypothetical protein